MQSLLSWIVVFCACATSPELTRANSFGPAEGDLGSFSDTFLRQVIARLGDDLGPDLDGVDPGAGAGPETNDEVDDEDLAPRRVAKEFPPTFRIRHDGSQNFLGPSIRDQEYLQHSSLWGNQYMQGGAGEGKQRLKPDGSIKNGQAIKTDAVLPAYCNPPNPCPKGYTAADSCLEDFTNTAAFSRDYQVAQECMCDSEHMFDCPAESGSKDEGRAGGRTSESEIEALARSMQHEGLVDSTLDRLVQKIEGEHKSLVAKKFFNKKVKKSVLLSGVPKSKHSKQKPNPYLAGEKLPVVAKKAPRWFD